jgi:hypothetical protein
MAKLRGTWGLQLDPGQRHNIGGRTTVTIKRIDGVFETNGSYAWSRR